MQYKLNRAMQVRRNMLLVFSAGAIWVVASGVMLAQAKEYSTDQDSSKQVVINNYYGGGGPYYPRPYFYPAPFYRPSFGCRRFGVSLVTPFHRRVFIHRPFRPRFLPRMFGSMRSGGRRY
ncbi:MAG: hypothetical protein HYR76_01220 [Ignavibacteria bacterium]|nr:hypothetical protein [Ignavibacteria bacterium]